MYCLKQCLKVTKEYAYAHHIQRLMVIGNFALLTGLDPSEVNEWYLIVYCDAHEWGELPNVSGMILFADGGYLASKPYAAGSAYINKMSDYCKNCYYSPSIKTGERACPFNFLYWNLLLKNRNLLEKNQRMKLVYSLLKKMDTEKLIQIQREAGLFIDKL